MRPPKDSSHGHAADLETRRTDGLGAGPKRFLVGSLCTRSDPDRNAHRARLAATAPFLLGALRVALAALQDTTPHVQNRPEVALAVLAIHAATGEAHVAAPRDYPAAHRLLQTLQKTLEPLRPDGTS